MIWTAGHFAKALVAAGVADDTDGMETLSAHGIHEDHCDGWEVLAWPCPPAAEVLDRLHEWGAL